MNAQNKRFQIVLDRINQNINAARMVADLSPVEFHFDSEYAQEYKYNLTNRSTGVYFGVGVAFDPYPQLKTKGHISYETPQIHKIGAVPEILLRKGRYFGNIWSGIETGDENKYRQFLNIYFNGDRLNGDQVGKTRSKAEPVVTELSDLIRKKDSNHADVLRAVDLSFKLLTFPDRDAVDLIGEIG